MTHETRFVRNVGEVQRRSSLQHFSSQSQPLDEAINLGELVEKIWAGKWLIAGVTILAMTIAIAITLSLPNIYRSEVLLAPAGQDEQRGMLNGLAGQFGGLASLAGINLSGTAIDKKKLALEVLKSRAFITEFIDKNDLLVPLFAAKGWDKEGGWILDTDIYDETRKAWTREPEPGFESAPSSWEAYKAFKKDVLSVSEDKSGLVRVSVDSISPQEAKRWLDMLIKELNEKTRQSDISEAKRSIQYLKAQLEKTQIADMQRIFYDLIEQQTRTVMLAEVREEYVFKTVDPSVVPEEKIKPKRTLIVVGATVAAFLLSVLIVLMLSRKENQVCA